MAALFLHAVHPQQKPLIFDPRLKIICDLCRHTYNNTGKKVQKMKVQIQNLHVMPRCTFAIESFQDFLIEFYMKLCMHLVEISIFH